MPRCLNSLDDSDLIFVLAGRVVRKRFGLELFRAGVAARILFSVARFEVRRFKELRLPVAFDLLPIALPVAAPERHFFVAFSGGGPEVERIKVRRFGTLREIEALAGYLTRHAGIRSVIVVTSAVHVRRVGICCRVLLPREVDVRVVAVPRFEGGIRGQTGGVSGAENVCTVRKAARLEPGATKTTETAKPAQVALAGEVTEPRASLIEFGTEMVKLGVYRALLWIRGRPRSQD